ARDHELLAGADLLELGHLEDGLDRLALRLADEAARVDHDDLGFVGLRRELVARAAPGAGAAVQRDADHDLGVDPVLRATEAHEMDLLRGHRGAGPYDNSAPRQPRPRPAGAASAVRSTRRRGCGRS